MRRIRERDMEGLSFREEMLPLLGAPGRCVAGGGRASLSVVGRKWCQTMCTDHYFFDSTQRFSGKRHGPF